MRYLLRALLAGSLGLAAALLVACGGGSGLLSSDQANGLNAKLDQVSSAVSSGQCDTATNAAQDFVTSVSNLPSSVNRTLVNNLKQGASTVAVLAARDCQTTSTTTTSSSTSTSRTTTSSSTPTTTTTSSSSTTISTPTTTAATSTATSGTSTGGSGSSSGGAGLGGASGGTGIGNGSGNGP